MIVAVFVISSAVSPPTISAMEVLLIVLRTTRPPAVPKMEVIIIIPPRCPLIGASTVVRILIMLTSRVKWVRIVVRMVVIMPLRALYPSRFGTSVMSLFFMSRSLLSPQLRLIWAPYTFCPGLRGGVGRSVDALLRLFLELDVLRKHLVEVTQTNLCDVAAKLDRKVVRQIAKLMHVNMSDVLQSRGSILVFDLEKRISCMANVLVIAIFDSDIFTPLFFRNTFDDLSTPSVKWDELHFPTL